MLTFIGNVIESDEKDKYLLRILEINFVEDSISFLLPPPVRKTRLYSPFTEEQKKLENSGKRDP